MEKPFPAYQGDDPYVFVSYSHEDEAARALCWNSPPGTKNESQEMKMLVRSTIGLVLCAFIVSVSNGAELYIYPNADQSAEQQKKDEFDCYHFGRDQTGFDPMVVPTATSARPESSGPSTGQRVVRGAALGGAVGAITGNSSRAKKYAGAGAATGALMGGAKKRDTQKQQKQWEQEQQQIYAQSRNEYNRAYAACMEGRQYTVR